MTGTATPTASYTVVPKRPGTHPAIPESPFMEPDSVDTVP
jgi:hypothetical protein